MTAWNTNRLTKKLGITYPLIQGPLGGFASHRLTAAVSEFGGLGSFGAHGLSPQGIRDVATEVREHTAKPFAINLWVTMDDEGAASSAEPAFQQSLAILKPYLDELGAAGPSYKPYSPRRFEDQVRALLDANVPVFSFIFGIPPREILEECRRRGIATIGGATTPDEARALAAAGVDAIVASGFEGGGHRGSFLRASEDSLYGTISLVPRIVDAVDIPVIAAGGIADARGMVAAFALGAEAVQMGTVFLACEESGASGTHRRAIREGRAGETALTKGFTGRLARGVRNPLMDEIDRSGSILPYPLQRELVRSLSNAAEPAGREDLLPMWAGQSAPLTLCTNVGTFLQGLIDVLPSIASPIAQWRDERRRVANHTS